jgi:UDP-glucose 4-epimerase
MTRSALITGGAGFIGSHLADRLLEDGWRVAALDNLAIGRLANVAHLQQHPRFSLTLGEVTDRELVDRLVREFDVEAIFHLAAVHYIPFCEAHPYEAMRINVLGTQAVIDAAAARHVRRIVFTSTSDVYAIKDFPLFEDDPVDPYTIYGNSKLAAERLLRVAAAKHERLSVAVARLFNVYGPRETNRHVLPEVLDQIKAGDGAVRLGNLWPKRDFVYVTDVAAALVELLDTERDFDVFNVGSGCATTIEQAMAAIEALIGRPLTIVADPERTRPVERACLHADITKITHATPWRPRHTFQAGMANWLQAEGLLAGV